MDWKYLKKVETWTRFSTSVHFFMSLGWTRFSTSLLFLCSSAVHSSPFLHPFYAPPLNARLHISTFFMPLFSTCLLFECLMSSLWHASPLWMSRVCPPTMLANGGLAGFTYIWNLSVDVNQCCLCIMLYRNAFSSPVAGSSWWWLPWRTSRFSCSCWRGGRSTTRSTSCLSSPSCGGSATPSG